MTDAGARVRYEFDGFQLDIQQRLLMTGTERRPVPLPPKIFDTLLYMVERRGELLEKTTLLKAIWPNVIVEENSLNQNISALRRALGENPGEHRYIVTEPGRGYRFVADVRVIAASPTVAAPARAPERRSNALRKSVAVLPFANLSGDPAKEYFGDGIAEELIHKLARVPGLRVPARTSSFAYKGRNVDVRQIAADLDVSVVLEGSVRSAGERLRITAQLIDGHNGFHLWSHSFDRKFEDLFELQDEIARAIVNALRITLDGADPAVSSVRPSVNLEAYHLFMQATARQAAANPQNIASAFAMYQQAVQLDPGFARAYNQMAGLRAIAPVLGAKLPGTLDDAEREASKALSLDPSQGGAHAAIGTVHALRGRWIESDERFQRAFAEDDTDPASIQAYAMLVLATAGYRRRYYETMLTAKHLAPAWVPVIMNVAVSETMVDRDEDALASARLAIDMGASVQAGPMTDVLGTLQVRAGRLDAAVEAHLSGSLPAQRAHGSDDVVRAVYRAIGDPSQRAAATRALDAFRARISEPEFNEILNRRMLVWYTHLGALDQAYELQEESLRRFARFDMLGGLWSFWWLREMAPFRQDARFQGIVERFALAPFWEKFGPPDGHELRRGKLVVS